ncbi:MAG: adenylate/guanylate cyclase domain-containing protein [Flavobacteriales bacterium]|nr:adenylate/guanylate cyclase domain-containing protein [Flavobacteriales bacterium]
MFRFAPLALAFTWSTCTVHANGPNDTLQVLRLLGAARQPSNQSIIGFVHDSALTAQALHMADGMAWQRGIFKGHVWALLGIAERNFTTGMEAWERHVHEATERTKYATDQELMLLYRTIGRAHVRTLKIDTAFMYLDSAQWAAERSGDERSIALVTYTRAHGMRVAERWGDAFRLSLRSNAMADALKDPLLKTWGYNLSGMVRGRLGDLEGAVHDFTVSLALADSMAIHFIRVVNHMNWGFVMQVKGRWSEALQQYRAVRAVGKEAGYPDETMVLPDLGIGHMLVRLDSLDEAEAILRRIRGTEALIVSGYEQEFNNAWALLQLRRGRFKDAVTFARTAFNTEQRDENDVIKRDASRILSEAYKALKRPAEALVWTELAHQWEDSVLYRQQANEALREEMDREMAMRVAQDSLTHAEETARMERANQERATKEKSRRNALVIGGIAILLVALFLWWRLRFTRRAKRAIEKEKDRSEGLLRNILPVDVAEELKAKGEADARLIDEATILFTDFKGFTAISEQLTARELVDELNECFKAFDHIITARGIEKIKTIGDAYMCAGGLSGTKGSSPLQVVLAALEMQEFMVKRKKDRAVHGLPGFDMRLGIHTGPVVAGIVGVKKFQYDIWGDTVNIASRMESSGEVGQVNISEATHTLVKDTLGLRFTSRGMVSAKGKGEMEMYFVERSGAGQPLHTVRHEV